MAGRDLFAAEPKGRDLFAQEVQPEQYDLPPMDDISSLPTERATIPFRDRVIQRAEEIRQQQQSGLNTALELGGFIGSSAIAEPVAGVAGIAQTLNPFAAPGAGARAVEQVRNDLTYQPRGQGAKDAMGSFAETVAPVVTPIVEGVDAAADYAFEKTGSPLVATIVKTLPAALAEYIGLKGLRHFRKGKRLINPDGTPTRQLEDLLNKDGLTFDQLKPEAKQLINDVAEPKLLPSPKSEALQAVEGVKAQQIVSKGREGALAPYKVIDGVTMPDEIATKAIDKGWLEGTVQMVKTANNSTRKTMETMLDMRWKLLKDDSLSHKLYPKKAVGESFMKRIDFLRDKAKTARVKLDSIARTKLRSVPIDTGGIEKSFYEMLDGLDVQYKINPNTGIPKLKYKGSIIQADRTSQKAINEALGLMSSGKVDAYRVHIFKRQLDSLIDFKKKSKTGITEEGRRFLKGLRHEANQTLRNTVDEYAEVNDVLSKVLTSFDEFKTATKVDVNMLDDASGVVGDAMGKLHTRYKARDFIGQSADRIDELANALGGEFNTNYVDLSMFANRMDEVFGASKSGSFPGLIEAAQTYTTEGGPSLARKVGGSIRDKFKGIDPYDQYQTMRDVITNF